MENSHSDFEHTRQLKVLKQIDQEKKAVLSIPDRYSPALRDAVINAINILNLDSLNSTSVNGLRAISICEKREGDPLVQIAPYSVNILVYPIEDKKNRQRFELELRLYRIDNEQRNEGVDYELLNPDVSVELGFVKEKDIITVDSSIIKSGNHVRKSPTALVLLTFEFIREIARKMPSFFKKHGKSLDCVLSFHAWSTDKDNNPTQWTARRLEQLGFEKKGILKSLLYNLQHGIGFNSNTSVWKYRMMLE